MPPTGISITTNIFLHFDNVYLAAIQVKNKFGTNNDASWMKQDEEEDEEEDEDEDEEEDSLLASQEPFRMISKLILAKFTV